MAAFKQLHYDATANHLLRLLVLNVIVPQGLTAF